MKYELTDETIDVSGTTLHRIKALKDFGNVKKGELGGYVKKGELGGYVESEYNLSQIGNCWVYGNARVCGDAELCGNAKVCGNARVCGNAEVCGNAKVCGNARVCGNAEVCGDAELCGNAWVYGNAEVCGNAWVYGNAEVYGDAKVCGNARVYGNADYITIKGLGSRYRDTTIFKTRNEDVVVRCGCFYGTLTEFVNEVGITHGDSKYAKEYLALVELAKIHFGIEK